MAGSLKLPIQSTTTPTPWTRPSDWIDISQVNNNEINLLVADGPGIGFATTVASSGTYSIDWGDGTVETARASGTTYQHQYTPGSGQACSQGYTTYNIRIYGATGNITSWKVKKHTYTNRVQYQPYLWVVFGTQYITDYSNAFYLYTYVQCRDLQACVIPSFQSCITTANSFTNCSALVSITLPTSWGSVTNTSTMFQYCYNLKTINNLQYLGSTTSDCDFTAFGQDCEFLQQSVSIASRLSKFGMYGASTYVLKVSSIRFTNANSQFGGTSPQVDVSYTSLAASNLNDLFGDLPTLSGKTINITGSTGAGTCDKTIATNKGWTVTG